MREVFECALLQVPGQAFAGSIDGGDRIRLHVHDLGETIPAGGDAGADTTGLLASAALALQRYDACLLYIEPATLPWVRMALARARALLRTPVLALVGDVKAAALADLLELGLADFVRLPVCHEELRARLMRLAGRMPLQEPMAVYGAVAPVVAVPASRASRARSRAPVQPPSSVNLVLYEPDESFRQAKARVVSGFERAYLVQALARHEGNVTQAARASHKHRRAFWALMHKHAIDARSYRASLGDEAAEPVWPKAPCRRDRARSNKL
jgi:DNA-binding response OmpR family regulator